MWSVRIPVRWGIFGSTRFLARLVGHDINIHDINMFHCINMVETKSAADNDGTIRDGSEINTSNIMNVTEEHLSNVQKEQLAQVVDGFKTACL